MTASPAPTNAPQIHATRIHAARLVPGAGEPIDRACVVIDDGRITYAGPAATAPSGGSSSVVDVEAHTVMPGLWDCHAHLWGLPRSDLVTMATEHPAAGAARAVDDARAMVAGGVTTIREVGGLGLHLSRPAREGRMVSPRIHGAGRILSPTGGHSDIHSLPVETAACAAEAFGFGICCDGTAEALRAVRLNLRAGAALIKVCASGGVMSEVDDPEHQQFSDDELTTIVGEATRAGRIVAAHCHGKAGIVAALRAGCRTIEHGSGLDEEAADLMLECGAILVPTRFVMNDLAAHADRLPAYAADKLRTLTDRHRTALELAIAKGVPIAAGCDMFVSGRAYGTNGLECGLLADAGMDPLGAIDAATANAPDTLGPRAPASGRLAAGYDADVITLDADPTDDLAVLGDPERVTGVWIGGVRHR